MGEVGACQSINWQGTELRWIAFYKDRIRLSLRQTGRRIGVKFRNHIQGRLTRIIRAPDGAANDDVMDSL